ncbi:MAG: TSUP family transporter [Eubacteriales bacterium]|nr:TSUP family transporter [Eubacteriales bacterium]
MGENIVLVYLVVCFFVFLAGFVDSIAGGGGLISLPAYMIVGLPAHTAIATNKISSAMGTTVSTFYYLRQGFMKWKICVPAIIAAVVGSSLGAEFTLRIDERILKIAMLIVLPVILFYVLRSKALQENPDYEVLDEVNLNLILKCIGIAFGIGIYDGIYGPGTGTFLMLLFTAFCHLSLHDAAGTTKAINLTTNLSALAVFLFNGAAYIPLGVAAGCCNMAGNYLGSHCFTSKGSKIVKPIMVVVIVIFFIKILTELIK